MPLNKGFDTQPELEIGYELLLHFFPLPPDDAVINPLQLTFGLRLELEINQGFFWTDLLKPYGNF